MKKQDVVPEKNDIIAEAIFDLSKSIRLLGNGNIARRDDSPGAIESLAMLIKESNEKMADSLNNIASAIRELAQSVEDKGK